MSDIIPHGIILSLPKDKYSDLNLVAEKYSLDFDDSYQVILAKENNLEILKMDRDFKKVKDEINVKFL